MGGIMEGWKFLKSLHMVGRGVLAHLFYEEQPDIAYLLFFRFLYSHPPATSLSPPTHTPTVLSVVLFLWLNG